MNKGLLILGGGVLLYYLYSQQKAHGRDTPAAAAAGASPAATQPPATPAVSSSPQRAAIVAAVNASGVSSTYIYGQQGPDTWNWYAMQAFPGWTAPTPETLYPGEPNVHTKTYTFDDWFSRDQNTCLRQGCRGTGRSTIRCLDGWGLGGGWHDRFGVLGWLRLRRAGVFCRRAFLGFGSLAVSTV